MLFFKNAWTLQRKTILMVLLPLWIVRTVKWYHCVCGQREQSKDATVYVGSESSYKDLPNHIEATGLPLLLCANISWY